MDSDDESRSDATGPDDDLALRLSKSARDLQQEQDPAKTLEGVVSAAIALVPGAQEGSISVVHGRRKVHSEAASSEFASRLDELQEEVGEGPCLSAVYEQQTVRLKDTRTEERWPLFSTKASEAGAGSVLSLQLFVEGDNLGALNLYAKDPDAFDEESEHVGLLFASHAAIAYAAARTESRLLRAVGTREVIGQAQGILMERRKITADQAFARLVRASQHQNVKLRDVAERLVQTGELGPSPDEPGTTRA